ncbi:MAG: ribose ABC transporter permease [Planctomycetes bacterium]|jgi:ribose transport system permease protein|nr:ribose ABC transporter permease [Planctomycetota bacterium]|tara:strand:+ start:426 stop:1433 length:1008 start_codon:yes stop_codon:yes gene_type:complete
MHSETTTTIEAGKRGEALSGAERRERVLGILSQTQSLVGLVLVGAIFAILSDAFLTEYNLLNILRQSAVTAILAAGMTFVIIAGGIDLSVGSVVALTGVIAAGSMRDGTPVWAAVLIALAIGLAFGAVNGVAVAVLKIPAFIATLGTMTIGSSVALAYTEGLPISGLPEAFTYLGQGFVGPIPTPVVIAFVVVVLCAVLLRRTLIGRYAFAIGGNEKASFLSGVRTTRWKITMYALLGVLGGIAGVVLTARQNSGQPTAGAGIELIVIAAVVIGGTSLSGGRGSVWGSIAGAVLITVINNGLNLLNVSPYFQGMFVGGLILLAVGLDWRNRKTSD